MIPRGEQWDEIAGLPGGDLSVTSYAVLLAAMARLGRSGVLRLARKPVEKKIFLTEGRPVECRSNLAHETFGRFLRSEGRLSQEDHNSALSESLSRGVPLGEVLIERGLLSPDEIYKNLQKNLAGKLLDGFTWQRGEFEVSEVESAADPTVTINAPQLILTGVLKLTPQAEIESGLEGLREEPLKLHPRPIFESTHLRLSGRAQGVAQAFEAKPLSLGELATAVSLPAEEVDRIVYALALLGRVLPASEAAERKGLVRPEPAAAPLPSEEPPPALPDAGPADGADAADDQALLRRRAIIVEAYLSVNRRDSFELLELEEGATGAEIEQAYLRAAENYAPWSLGERGAGDFVEQGELLFLRAARAYAELKNSESRGALIHRRKVLRDEEAERKKPKFSIKTDLLDSEEQFKKGLALVERGELGKALELLEFAADCDPQKALYRAELAYRRDQFDSHRYRKQAIADLREAIRIDPGCGSGHFYLGLVLGDQGDVAGAEKALRKSIKLMAPDRRPIEALKELAARKKR